MSISVEITSSLGRRLTVKVPAEKVNEMVNDQLSRMTHTIKLDGFRKGKIPRKVMEQRFGKAAHAEAVEKLLQSSLQNALREEKLHPATMPTVQSLKAEPGMPLEYNVTFDVYPEIKLKDISGVTLEKHVVTIENADVERVLEQMRKQHVLWEDVQRPAQLGDRLTVDMQGLLHGETVEKAHDKNVQIVLDETTMPKSFLALVGASAGDAITLDLTQDKAASPQTLSHVLVTIHAVAEPKLPEIDAEFALKLGTTEGGVDALRADVRKHMEQEIQNVLKNRLKEQVFNALLERHPLELPQGLLDEECRHMEEDLRKRIKQETQQKTAVQLSKTDREKIQEIARRRITLGLLLSTLIEENHLKADEKQVMEQITRLMGAFENTGNMRETLLQNPKLMEQIRSQVLENQAVDHLLTQVTFHEKPISYSDALELSKKVHDHHDHDHHDHDHHDHDHHHGPSDAPIR